jgi:nucleoside-diphosphate-sugar epimerase
VVTGAAGFVGSFLCERLIADGWQVVGVDAFTDYYPRAEKEENLSGLAREPGFALVEADVVGQSWRSVVRAGDTVFHLAAQPGVRGSFGVSFARYARDNVVASQRLFEAAHDARCRRVVWASSSSVYGDAPDFPCSEHSPTRPRSPYGVTKRACEDLAGVYRDHGLAIVGLRYFTVYGPRQRPDMAMRLMCEAVLAGTGFAIYGDGFQSRDFTFVTDACDATVRAAAAAEPAAIYNVGGGAEASLARVVEIVERLAGTRLDVRRVAHQRGDVWRTAADTTAARRDLGWRPVVDLEDGLRRELEWVQKTTSARRVA